MICAYRRDAIRQYVSLRRPIAERACENRFLLPKSQENRDFFLVRSFSSIKNTFCDQIELLRPFRVVSHAFFDACEVLNCTLFDEYTK